MFGSGILLRRELLNHASRRIAPVLAAGTLTLVHMGLLGAVLTFADRPMFQWHFITTQAWGLTPLQDQQLGGTVMWVPGIVLFLWAAIRSIVRMRESLERARPACLVRAALRRLRIGERTMLSPRAANAGAGRRMVLGLAGDDWTDVGGDACPSINGVGRGARTFSGAVGVALGSGFALTAALTAVAFMTIPRCAG